MEVVLVRFALFPFLFWLVTKLLPNLQTWQTERLQLPFPVTGHILMVIVSLLMIIVTNKRFDSYGITFRPLKYHLSITATCIVPVILASIPFGLGVDYRNWNSALILAGVEIILLVVIGWKLKKHPGINQVGVFALVWVTLVASPTESSIGKALAEFVTYGVFVAFGEEIIFRGCTQSRLNEAFDRPYRFFGVEFGWGVVITAMLFGLTHIGLTTSLITGQIKLYWAWGFWTFFRSISFSLIREKSGSILAPSLLHGLPQAIASSIMVMFS